MITSGDDTVSRAVGGDADALTTLLKTHGPGVRRRLSIDPVWRTSFDLDDVLQVTYTEAFLHIDQLSGRGAATPRSGDRTLTGSLSCSTCPGSGPSRPG